ncbi:MAG: HAMP domain-containing protein [Candidatus Omnitrophica bacterium]|nr:HAMP domain-containing protein [Candidatus Omnitrophota bacterium]
MRLNIQYKITIIFVLLFAVILFGTYLYLDNALIEKAYRRMKTNLLKESVLTKMIFEKAMSDGTAGRELDLIANEVGESLGLRVTLIGLDGKVLGDTDLDQEELARVENHLYRPEVQEALLTGTGESIRFSTTVQKNLLYMAKRMDRGVVRLAVPLSDVEFISSRLKRTLSVSILLAFLFAMIASFFTSILISKPLRSMSELAKKIAGGDFSERVLIRSNDEIGDLAKSFNDMSEQIRARIDEVITGRSRFEAVLLNMFDGVMVVDSRGIILLMNPSLMSVLMVQDNPAGKKPVEVLRNVDVQEMTDSVLKLTEGVESREITLLLDEEKTFFVHGTPILREEKTEGAVLVFHDITELRKLEKIRKDFVANVSHELRTPVSNIQGYSETLLEGALEDKTHAEEFVRIIHAAADRLAKLIEDLLSLSGIESGKVRSELKPCSIYPITRKVLSGLERQAREKNINIEVNIPGDLPEIMADDMRISQVMLNLVDNAIKYSEEGGSVEIRASREEGLVKISVFDNGIGIPERDLPRIFERFYRVDKARSRELGGTGLGLSIVKHIIQDHGGDVWVESTPGKGSTFFFTVPRA